MAQYLILLYDSPAAIEQAAQLSPDEIQAVMEKYFAWNDRLEREGRLRGGAKLKDGTGRVLRGAGDRLEVIDGPFTETKEVLGGYFTIEAADYEDAVAVARSCPHLDFGGTVEIREVDPVDAPAEA